MHLPLMMMNVEIFMSLSGQNLVVYRFKTFRNENSCVTHPCSTFQASLTTSVTKCAQTLIQRKRSVSFILGQVCVCVCNCA